MARAAVWSAAEIAALTRLCRQFTGQGRRIVVADVAAGLVAAGFTRRPRAAVDRKITRMGLRQDAGDGMAVNLGGGCPSWPDAVEQAARDWWNDGRSGSEIVTLLARKYGFATTRSAVLGQAQRGEGWIAKRDANARVGLGVGLGIAGGLARVPPARTCQWPNGDPGTPEFHLCGAEPLVGATPYCAAHHPRAYLKPQDPERLQNQALAQQLRGAF